MRFGEYPTRSHDLSPTSPDEDSTDAASDAGEMATDDIAASAELAALRALGLSKPLLARMQAIAAENRTTVEAELLAGGEIDETAYYAAMARFLRIPFVSGIDAGLVTDTPHNDTQLQRPLMLRLNHRHRLPQTAVVPQAGGLAALAAALVTMPMLGRDLAVTTPSAIRSAVWKAGEDRRVREAINRLFETRPWLSARIVLAGGQGFCIGAMMMASAATLVVDPVNALYLFHVALSHAYLASLILRILALILRRSPRPTMIQPGLETIPLPRYTVMVALYREADICPQLVASLGRLDWPRSLLDIKLVCEADDSETIAAIRNLKPGPQFEIIDVPPQGPRTKPKALTYALAAVRGEFTVIYDAEDRPHPGQLREAYRRFRAAAPDLACLQAPLIVTNARESWLSALFALEYAALFRGLLPLLARLRMPLPLGGTSNHFRTRALVEVGGWDPFNVTEDADLGLRLYRLGYRADVLRCQTLEDAPVTAGVWMGQRRRWFKGWLQTWLVVMRDPVRLLREMGLGAFLTLQLTIGGMLLSSLLHPLIILFIALGFSAMLAPPATEIPLDVLWLFTVDCANIAGSYLVFVALGIGAMIDQEKRRIGLSWALVPAYWLMTSLAAWQALIELKTKPFFWHKTPHRPSTPPGHRSSDQ